MAKAPLTIKLDEKTKELFKLMHFEEIPEEATYVSFFEDGYAQFVEDIIFSGVKFPHLTMIAYYTDIDFPDYE